MVYSVGNKIDYDRWSDLLEDPSWSYANLLPVFKMLENFTRTNPFVPIDVDYHGYDGSLQISQRMPTPNMSFIILNGIQKLGYDLIDYNGHQQLGASLQQYFTKNGRRYDNGRAFISGVKYRKNLLVLDESYVTKIEICAFTKRATGVIFSRKNKLYIARSRKEVVLAAGAISSPQILMLSGIGPRSHLESLEIPVIQNLPVGRNLHDHPAAVLVLSTNVTEETESMEQSVKDFIRGRGTLTSSMVYDAFGWLKTQSERNENLPNFELPFSNFSDSIVAQKHFGWTNETFKALNPNVPNRIYMYLSFLHPKSKGTVTLKSNSSFDYPLIDYNLLSDNFDIESLYQGVQLVSKLTETEAFRSINATWAFSRFPGCNHTKPLSKKYWYCYLRKVTSTLYHPMSTCRMGTNSKKAVVDRTFKVFGVKRLRVADASVIPFPLSSNINAPCTMLGQRVSDLIKEEYTF